MGILPAFTLFGIDIFGFLRKKPQHTTVLSQISTLQTLHSLVTDAEDPKIGTAEEEIVDITRAITQKIGEKEMLTMGAHLVPHEALEQIVRKATFPNATYSRDELVDLENLLDIPKSVVDVALDP